MGTVETGSRHWPIHGGGPLAAPAPAPATPTPTSAPFSSRGPTEPRSNLWTDRSSKSDSLPPIAFLELNRTNMDKHPAVMTAATTGSSVSNTPLVSPITAHHHQSAPTSGHISPRRPGEDKEQHQQSPFVSQQRAPVPQSLPSIHEALGGNSALPYPVTSQQGPHPGTNAVPQTRRDSDGPSGPPNPFSNPKPPSSTNYPQPPQRQQEPAQRSSIASIQSQDSIARSMPSLSSGRSPTQSTRTVASSSSGQSLEHPATYAMSSPTSYPHYPRAQPQSQQHPHPHSHPHPHPHPHPQPQPQPQPQPPMAYAAPMAPAQPTVVYPAAVPYDARTGAGPQWNGNAPDMMQVDQQPMTHRASAPVPYSESVKRHLEGYDFEASLSELAEASGRTLDFSRIYAARAQQTNHSLPLAGLPSASEVDSMMQLQRRSLDNLLQIRNAAVNQEHAMAEQQQHREREHVGVYREEPKVGGFAGGDTKKRRGKAAPPGRCHSCNRAETPEWRRGPDGARTLCNACGLHYAKLTRKLGVSKASSLASNFRPRTAGQP